MLVQKPDLAAVAGRTRVLASRASLMWHGGVTNHPIELCHTLPLNSRQPAVTSSQRDSMHSLSMTDIVLRLLTALACGAAIGLNRDLHHKPAGFRTFGLVSLGSAAVTLVMLQIPGSGADAVSCSLAHGRPGCCCWRGAISHCMALAGIRDASADCRWSDRTRIGKANGFRSQR
jgi:MgtC family protein